MTQPGFSRNHKPSRSFHAPPFSQLADNKRRLCIPRQGYCTFREICFAVKVEIRWKQGLIANLTGIDQLRNRELLHGWQESRVKAPHLRESKRAVGGSEIYTDNVLGFQAGWSIVTRFLFPQEQQQKGHGEDSKEGAPPFLLASLCGARGRLSEARPPAHCQAA